MKILDKLILVKEAQKTIIYGEEEVKGTSNKEAMTTANVVLILKVILKLDSFVRIC